MGKIALTGNPMVDRIKETAADKGVSLKFLCEKIGRGKTYFSDVVNGSGEIPRDRLDVIARTLGTTVEYLLTGEATKKAPSETGERQKSIMDAGYFRVMQSAQDKGYTPEDIQLAIDFLDRARKRDEN